MHYEDSPVCFQAHMGLWAIEPRWLTQAVQALKHDLWPIRSPEMMAAEMTRQQGKLYTQSESGVAVIRIDGSITKGLSKFGGTSTILTRRAIRQAVQAEDIASILLAIDSPGGHIDGVQDLADEVGRARQSKTVDAYAEDLCASAAYWIASQARRITANATAFIGSIGAFAVLQDLSGLAEREGIQVRVVSTGPYKGLGAPGTPVTQALVDEVQQHVDQIGAFFFRAVQQGRGLSAARLAAVTDGRLWIAADALALRLLDGIGTFDDALTTVAQQRPTRRAATTNRAQILRAAWEKAA